MRWLGLAIAACLVAFLSPALAQTPGPQTSPAASPEPVIEVTVGPLPDAPASPANPAASASHASSPIPRPRRGSRSKASPTPAPTLQPTAQPSTPLPTPVPSPIATPTSSPTYKPIYYHGVPIYPKAGFGLPSPTVRLEPTAAPATAAPATKAREKYYWNVPTPVASPLPTPVPQPPVAVPTRTPAERRARNPVTSDDAVTDRSTTLIGGRWSCMSFAGTKLSHRYSRGDDGLSFDVVTTFVLSNTRTAKARETYRFEHDALLWRVKLSDGSIVATAPPWIGLTWTFTGSAKGDDRKPIGFRMIYTYLGQNVFRRDFERLDDAGAWNVYAGETCRRAFAQE